MKVLTIATNSVVRLFRERTNIFFVFILPLLLVMIIGLVFGGGFTPRIGPISALHEKPRIGTSGKALRISAES